MPDKHKSTQGFQKGHIPWIKGRHPSEETRIKLSLAGKGRILSKEHKEKLSKLRKGIIFTEEHKRKISLGKKGFHPKTEFKKGQNIGKKNHSWKGGITNYERKLYLNRKRRVRKLGNGGTHMQGEWEFLKIQYNFTCPNCKKQEPEIKLTEDHIIPLSRGGSDNIENIQPLCKSCNCKKHNKIINFMNKEET